MSNNEPQQDNECEREQARDDDVEIVFVNWIVDRRLLQWSRDDDRTVLRWILYIRVVPTGAVRAGRDISTGKELRDESCNVVLLSRNGEWGLGRTPKLRCNKDHLLWMSPGSLVII